jgi:hypothetical protein
MCAPLTTKGQLRTHALLLRQDLFEVTVEHRLRQREWRDRRGSPKPIVDSRGESVRVSEPRHDSDRDQEESISKPKVLGAFPRAKG